MVAELTPLDDAVGRALAVPASQLNLAGACVHGDRRRWFQRGNPAGGAASASVDVARPTWLEAATGRAAS